MKPVNLISEHTLRELQKNAREERDFRLANVEDKTQQYEMSAEQFTTLIEALKQNQKLSSRKNMPKNSIAKKLFSAKSPKLKKHYSPHSSLPMGH